VSRQYKTRQDISYVVFFDKEVMSSTTYPWMGLAQIKEFEWQAAALGVSEVARSSRGFLTAYKRNRGGTARMERVKAKASGEQTWAKRRINFLKRHLAQYRVKPTYRRFLSLIMWAYMPSVTSRNKPVLTQAQLRCLERHRQKHTRKRRVNLELFKLIS
jgi:hypothetical protein